jgi:hypothetical protein
MESPQPNIDEIFDLYDKVLKSGFIPDRVYYQVIDRWVDQDHPLTDKEFTAVFGEAKES